MMHIRVIILAMLVSGCGVSPLNLLTGGGPNVAANVQAGQENRQAGVSLETTQTITRPQARDIEQIQRQETRVRTEKVETLVIQEQVPAWIWALVLIGWILDSPLRWPGQIMKALRRD